MSLMKNIKSYYPKNGKETKKVITKISNMNGPAFVSLKNDKDLNKNW